MMARFKSSMAISTFEKHALPVQFYGAVIANFRERIVARGAVRINLTRLRFSLLTALLAARAPLTIDELAGHVYGGRLDGGPDDAAGSIYRIINVMRRPSISYHPGKKYRYEPCLTALGLDIEHAGIGYKIVILDVDTAREAA